MAMTLRKRVPRPQESSDSDVSQKRPKPAGRRAKVRRPAPRRRARWSSRDSDFDDTEEEEEEEEDEEEVPEYEKIREQRMRENKEKMEKLGIFCLSQKFKPQILPRRGAQKRKPSVTRAFAAPYERARRTSSRQKEVGGITYFKDEGTLESMGISVPEEWAPEIYTEEHEKLLGDCEKPWELYVDGYEDGERLYDPLTGKMCHQCRQKTVGEISLCRKCKLPQGQLCGDCLYIRYGENVLEANENVNWSCPSCRDICNCSRCRRAKGWNPTICAYQKVIEQGHKSIAHYIIHSLSAKNKPKGTSGLADSNTEPELNSQSAPQMIYSDSSESSSDVDEPDGYNSDSSEEEEKNREASVAVDDEEECETVDAVGKEDEVIVDEVKDA